MLVVGLLAVRINLPVDVASNIVFSVALVPISIPYLARFRYGVVCGVLFFAATVAGILIAAASVGDVSASLMVTQSSRILGVVLLLAGFLWARSLAGVRLTVLAFAVGACLSVLLNGVNDVNPWKYSLSIPIGMLVLSLPGVFSSRVWQAALGISLAVVSLIFDSRSLAGFLLVAVALTITQRSHRKDTQASRSVNVWLTIVRFSAIVGGAFLLVQAAILEGMLGEGIQARTQAQIQTSGSVIAGGRPEMGASFALITHNPLGFGSGRLVSPSEVLVAKSGMAGLGYDPNNGYVESYMFGRGFEVHSVFADLWILAGPFGAAAAVGVILWLIRGVAREVTIGAASTIAVFLVTKSLWDVAFSPLPTSITALALAMAVVAEPYVRYGSTSGATESFGAKPIAVGPTMVTRRQA